MKNAINTKLTRKTKNKTVNLVILREDSNTAWCHSIDTELFPFFLEDMFRLWLEKIQDEDTDK